MSVQILSLPLLGGKTPKRVGITYTFHCISLTQSRLHTSFKTTANKGVARLSDNSKDGECAGP